MATSATTVEKGAIDAPSGLYTILDVDITTWAKRFEFELGPLSLRLKTVVAQNASSQDFTFGLEGAAKAYGHSINFSKTWPLRKNGNWVFDIVKNYEKLAVDISNWNYESQILTFDLVLKVGIRPSEAGWVWNTIHSSHITAPVTPRDQLDQLFNANFSSPQLAALLIGKSVEIHELNNN